jgi:hypothetical protein
MFDKNHHVAGPEPLFGKDDERCLDDATFTMTAFAVDPTVTRGNLPTDTSDGCLRIRRSIGWALSSHPATGQAASPLNYSAAGRNEVIGNLLAASDRKCDRYTMFIGQFNSNVKVGFGALAHAGSTLAEVATGGVAKALSVLASTATDASARLENGHFSDQALPIIVGAYVAARESIRTEIENHMKNDDTSKYTVGQGIADAFRYHAACSVEIGLAEANKAVQEKANEADKNKNPGGTSEANPGGSANGGSAAGGATAGTSSGRTAGAGTAVPVLPSPPPPAAGKQEPG